MKYKNTYDGINAKNRLQAYPNTKIFRLISPMSVYIKIYTEL